MQKDYMPVRAEEASLTESAFVEEFWTQRWGTGYELRQTDDVMRCEEYRLMHTYLSKLPEGSRILDGGCGTGAWTVSLTNQGFNVIGMDLSRRTVEWLQTNLPDYQFVWGDIRHTGFEDRSFDAFFRGACSSILKVDWASALWKPFAY